MQMTEEIKATHSVPSDLKQIPIVWKYELLKYLRSKRLLASLAIAVVVLGLLYALPPALGQPYSGTDSGAALYMLPAETFPGGSGGPFNPTAAGIINRSQIDVDTLVVYMDGDQYPAGSGANWFVSKLTFEGQSVYVVFFMQDVTGHVMTASYDWYTAAESFETLFLNFAGILVVVCATFFGADALVSEFQNRTGYLIFPNPVRREVLFFGKFAASMTAGILVMTLFYGVLAGLSAYTARGIDDDYILSYAFALEYLLAVMAVAYLISTLSEGDDRGDGPDVLPVHHDPAHRGRHLVVHGVEGGGVGHIRIGRAHIHPDGPLPDRLDAGIPRRVHDQQLLSRPVHGGDSDARVCGSRRADQPRAVQEEAVGGLGGGGGGTCGGG